MKIIIHQHDEVTSTNDIAIELAKEGCLEGTVVSAKSQTKGRGRRDNRWVSPSGGLYISLILKPRIEIKLISLFPIFFAGTIIKFIKNNYNLSPKQAEPAPNLSYLTENRIILSKKEYHANIEPKLKWPNDIMLNNKKLGGILIQSEITQDKIDYLVVGIGINLKTKPQDSYLGERDVSHLSYNTDKEINLDTFQNELLDFIQFEYLQFILFSSTDKINYILNLWNQTRESSDKINLLRDRQEEECRIIRLNEDGTLRVEFPNGLIEDLVSEETRIIY